MAEKQGISLVQRSLAAEAAIAFGAPVAQGAGGPGYAREGSAALPFAGVAVVDPTKDSYVQYDLVKVGKIGVFPVLLEKTVAVGTPENRVEGVELEVSATAGGFQPVTTGSIVARLAEHASFPSTDAAGAKRLFLATLV